MRIPPDTPRGLREAVEPPRGRLAPTFATLGRALRGHPFLTSRPPRVRDGVLVLASDGRTCQALSVARGVADVRVDAVAREEAPPSAEVLRALVERLRSPHRAALLVTSEATPEVLHDRRDAGAFLGRCGSGALAYGWVLDSRPPGGDGLRCLVTHMPRARRAWWVRTARALGLWPEGLYPLVGTALAGLRLDGSSGARLVIQLEVDRIALIQAVATSCRGLDTYRELPRVQRCAQLIGDGCPEVSLCGGGVDLSAFGYELVRSGSTWVHLPRLCCAGSSLQSSDAALVGAARHAFGRVATDAVACLPPRDP